METPKLKGFIRISLRDLNPVYQIDNEGNIIAKWDTLSQVENRGIALVQNLSYVDISEDMPILMS